MSPNSVRAQIRSSSISQRMTGPIAAVDGRDKSTGRESVRSFILRRGVGCSQQTLRQLAPRDQKFRKRLFDVLIPHDNLV